MLAGTVLTAQELTLLWRQCGRDETLPDRYELSEHGELIMSPRATNRQQLLAAEIAFQLRSLLGGKAVVEAAVLTRDAGVRVPDVVWMPAPRWAVVGTENDLLQGPDLVVEVLSPGNRRAGVRHKPRAYLDSGITEVMVVALDGGIVFQRADGEHGQSAFGVVLDLPDHLFS